MRRGPIDIALICPFTGGRFSEKEIRGKAFFVATPGCEYRVQISMKDQAYLYPPSSYLKLILRIDGQCIGYSGYIEPDELFRDHCEYTFYGYLRSCNGSSARFYAFTLNETALENLPGQPSLNVGVIELWVYLCRCNRSLVHWSFQPEAAKAGKVKSHQVERWQRPSISTTVGREMDPLEVRSLQLDDVNCDLLHYVQCRYHTISALYRLSQKIAHPIKTKPSIGEFIGSAVPTAVATSTKHNVKGVSLFHTEGGRILKRRRDWEEEDSGGDNDDNIGGNIK